jgi:Ner family transcriptional regulator
MENLNIQKQATERWEWCKYQLRLKGYSLRRLGKEHGVTGKAVEAVLRQNAPKWERIIAEIIGKSAPEIWPERYDNAGLPIRHSTRYPREDNTSRITRQRLTKGRV